MEMSTNAGSSYKATLADLRKELQRIEAHRQRVLAAIKALETFLDGGRSQENGVDAMVIPGLNSLSRADAAYEYLKRYGRPSLPSDIAFALLDMGFPLKSGNPRVSMGRAIRKDPRFCQERRYGPWGLVEWEAAAEAGHEGEHEARAVDTAPESSDGHSKSCP